MNSLRIFSLLGVANADVRNLLSQTEGSDTNDAMNPQVMDVLKYNVNWNNILRVKTPAKSWVPSTVYKAPDLIEATKKMTEVGVGKLKLIGGSGNKNAHYALVNIAAFLAQSMKETIQYDACDENNWDNNSHLTAANSCGQLGQSYQDYKCGAGEPVDDMACEVDPNMEIIGDTHAVWYGAPGPMFCAPKSKVPKAPHWNNATPGKCTTGGVPVLTPEEFWDYISHPEKDDLQCRVYQGQQAGGWDYTGCGDSGCPNAPAPKFGKPARTDVEGCCWWGRGVIQTTGVCNFGKLNYYAGARAKREGRDALFGSVDFCKTPEEICTSKDHPDLKWIAGFFFWASEVQSWPTDDKYNFDYAKELAKWTDAGKMDDDSFINKLSGIVNRGCPAMSCPAGAVDGAPERADNFKRVLKEFGFPWSDQPITTGPPIVTTNMPTTVVTTPGPKPGFCNQSCPTSCVGTGGNATDEQCAPCKKGQTYWPCATKDLCKCAAGDSTVSGNADTNMVSDDDMQGANLRGQR
jgi:predicted chitinase